MPDYKRKKNEKMITIAHLFNQIVGFMTRPINRLLAIYIAPRTVYIRAEAKTRHISISPLSQVFMGFTVIALLGWSGFSGSLLLVQRLDLNPQTFERSDFFYTAYQKRLDLLLVERDQRTKEAQTAQKRFYVAMGQISQQQSDLLKAEAERRELHAGLETMQAKLHSAVKERDFAKKEAQSLLDELRTATTDITYRDVEKTETMLRFVTDALEDASTQRDSMRVEKNTLEQNYAKLEQDVHLIKERGNQILAQIGDATIASLLPLENSLKKKGININSLLQEVRLGYSGIGGPADPLVFSDDPFEATIFAPAGKVLEDLDRLSLLQLGVKKLPLAHPVKGRYRYTSGYGMRRDPFDGQRRLHKGHDFAGSKGTDITATGDGVVIFAGRYAGYGKLIKIRHGQGFVTYYAHLSKILVKRGQEIELGDHIGEMGSTGRSTGTHLHYEVHYKGRAVNPAKYMRTIN